MLQLHFSFSGWLCLFWDFCASKQTKIFCSSSLKNVLGNLIGIALKLLIALGSIVILIILILLIQEHGISFHPFVPSLISLISFLNFSEYRSFVSLGEFIPSYFIPFDVMVNGIVFLISLEMQLISVY